MSIDSSGSIYESARTTIQVEGVVPWPERKQVSKSSSE